jgi:hypothetical protein
LTYDKIERSGPILQLYTMRRGGESYNWSATTCILVFSVNVTVRQLAIGLELPRDVALLPKVPPLLHNALRTAVQHCFICIVVVHELFEQCIVVVRCLTPNGSGGTRASRHLGTH